MRRYAHLVEDVGTAWIVGSDPASVDALADRLRLEGRGVSQRLACVVVRRNGKAEKSYIRLCTNRPWKDARFSPRSC